MKITIYELLGLVKDGKQPNKIKYNGQEYKFYKDSKVTDYCFECFEDDEEELVWLSTCIGNGYISDIFTNTVEIIEEPKKIEKLIEPIKLGDIHENLISINKVAKKVNELIDEINDLKEKKDD